MVSMSTVLHGIVVFLLAGSFYSVFAHTLEEQFQQLRSDYVLIKELLEKNIIRFEKQQARLEVLEMDVQQPILLEKAFEKRVNQLEASLARAQEQMTEFEGKAQQEDVESAPQFNRSTTTLKSIPNGVIDFIQENKGLAVPTDAASIVLSQKRVIRMDYDSVTLNIVQPSCTDLNNSQQCERKE